METLKNFKIYGNPVKNMKREIIDKPSKFILDYLKDKHPVQFIQTTSISSKTTPSQSSMEIEETPTFGYGNKTPTDPISSQGNAMRSQNKSYQSQDIQGKTNQPQEYMNKLNNSSFNSSQTQPVQIFEEVKSSKSLATIQSEVAHIDKTIEKLENELRDNFNMSKPQQMMKKKEINSLRATKNKLLNDLK